MTLSNPSRPGANASPRILILGAGPTGIGAAVRLHELGHDNFLVLERSNHAGGLASSFTDERGFVWDVGGHVQFSHYEYFDDLMVKALGDQWLEHERESYIWIYDRFIPYPLQNNLKYLPREAKTECVLGLMRASKEPQRDLAHFKDWIASSFGAGIAEHFLFPYNYKVWAYPPERMSYSWIGERVARVDVEKVVENILLDKDDVLWGPNSRFKFPLQGGTGAIWRSLASQLPQNRFRFNCEVTQIDSARKIVTTENGEDHPYDLIISSMPLDKLAVLLGDEELISLTKRLLYSTTHIIGIGFEGRPCETLKDKCWMYFPEDDCPFYRVTLFSKYSYRNVPDPNKYWSLMAEVSESPEKAVDYESLMDDVIQGMYTTRLARPQDRIASRWIFTAPHGYPTPSIDRDEILTAVHPRLEAMEILSRGRFGAWKYEVSNQDHSCMQGVEAVNRIMLGIPEITQPFPSKVNNRGGPVPREESLGAP